MSRPISSSAAVWAMRSDMPDDMYAEIRQAVLEFPEADSDGYATVNPGGGDGVVELTHEDFEDLVDMMRQQQEQRRGD